jgi:hypothetical protein
MKKTIIGKYRLYSGLDIFDIEEGAKPKSAIPSDGEINYRVIAVRNTLLGSVVLAGTDEKMHGGYSVAALFSKFCDDNQVQEAIFTMDIGDGKFSIIGSRKGIPIIDTEVDADMLNEYINDIHINSMPSLIQFGSQGQNLNLSELAALIVNDKKAGLLTWKTLPVRVILILAGIFGSFAAIAFFIWNAHAVALKKEQLLLQEMTAEAQITLSPKQLFEAAQKSYFEKNKHCSKEVMLIDFKRLTAIPEKIGGFEIESAISNCEEGRIITKYAPEKDQTGIYLFFLKNAQEMVANNWKFSASTSLNEVKGTLESTKEEINIAGGHPIDFKTLPLFSDWIIERGSWMQMIGKVVGIKANVSPPIIAVKKISESEPYSLGAGKISIEGDIIYAVDIIEKTPEILIKKLSVTDNGKKFKIEGDYYVRM